MEFDKAWIHGLLHLVGYDHVKNKDYYKSQYSPISNGDYVHKTFKFSSTQYFKLTGSIKAELSDLLSK